MSTVAVVTLLAAPALTQTMGQAEDFSANAIDINTGGSGRLEMSVTRWSTPAERTKLVDILFEKGPDALLKAVADMRPVGRIHTPGSVGYELRYASQRPLPEGGREITLATDRPMSFRELFNSTRSKDYPFTWIQMQIKPDGTGQGKIAVAARITGDKDDRVIEVEDFATQPVRLESVKAEKHRK